MLQTSQNFLDSPSTAFSSFLLYFQLPLLEISNGQFLFHKIYDSFLQGFATTH